MAKNTSVSLSDHFEEFIACQVGTGRYGSVSEVVRAGLRLLESSETKTEVLRRLLDEGENSGAVDYSLNAFINELDAEN